LNVTLFCIAGRMPVIPNKRTVILKKSNSFLIKIKDAYYLLNIFFTKKYKSNIPVMMPYNKNNTGLIKLNFRLAFGTLIVKFVRVC
jgi:hypothetical protein